MDGIRTTLRSLLVLGPAAAVTATLPGGAAPGGDFEETAAPFLEEYCSLCHGEQEPKAGVSVTAYTSAESALADPETWDFIRELVAEEEMPPSGQAQPSAEERRAFLAWIEGAFGAAKAREVGPIDPGRPVLRRLNHTEYRNTVRDLLGVDFPTQERFGAEAVGHGFDNVGEALFLTEQQFEKYVDAGREIAERAILIEDTENPPRTRMGPGSLNGRVAGNSMALSSVGEINGAHRFPRDGEYFLRIRAWGQQAGPEACRMELRLDGKTLREFEVEAERGAPETYGARVRVAAGKRLVAGAFINDFYRPENPEGNRDRNLYIDWIEVEGPVDPPPLTGFQRALEKRFGAWPEGRKKRRAALEHVLTRAWRRPVGTPEIAELDRMSDRDADMMTAVRAALPAVLASPPFLFRFEFDPPESEPGSVRDLNGWELATRLSYFLWSTLPDDHLFKLAEEGLLTAPEVLEEEVERMLRHPNARALAENFAAQWLQVRNLEGHSVDPDLHPGFGEPLRAAMAAETLTFFEMNLREERSVWDLLDAEFTYVNQVLAEHYGIEGVVGPQMRQVSTRGLKRRGILGQASILTVTSDPTRTSPVKRGKFVLESILGAPPPPPPPGADSIDESAEAAAESSLRERLERHRRDPACAICHETMDGLGFGLEPYDAVGRWRERDGRHPIDASAELPDGRSFDGPLEMVAVLREDDAFLRCLVEKLLIYGLGRGLERADRRTVDRVLERIDPERPTLAGIIHEIVLSDAFRRRRVGEAP